MRRFKRWVVAKPDEAVVSCLCSETGIDPIVAQLLVNRGITEAAGVRSFLDTSWDGTCPALEGIDQAARVLLAACRSGQAIAVHGDYDADGVCSTAILTDCLKGLGGKVIPFLPNRFDDGYGLSEDAVRSLAEQGCSLLVTVDCGISSVAEVGLAREMGMQVIVTDHHQPGTALPEADVVINPRLQPEGPGQELCGAGVVFCLVHRVLALLGQGEKARQWMDMAGLATVADIVPLTGFSRILVAQGLKLINEEPRPGIRSLLKAAGVSGEITSYHLGFVLGPRINAAGRMGDASPALELLLTKDPEEADRLSVLLEARNRERQRVEEIILAEAVAQIGDSRPSSDQVLVVDGDDWHQGVIGIVASRLVKMFGRPAVMITWDGDRGKGSARSLPGFDIYAALTESAAALDHFGGHRQAAGLELTRDNLSLFVGLLQSAARGNDFDSGEAASLTVDLELAADSLSPSMVQKIQTLAPFGTANPEPVVVCRRVVLEDVKTVGKGTTHLKARIRGSAAEVIWFRAGELASELEGLTLDLAFKPRLSNYGGRTSVSLAIEDIKRSAASDDESDRRPVLPGVHRNLDLPVVVVFPTRRCLDRCAEAFREEYGMQVVALKGSAPPAYLDRAAVMLDNGEPRLFLTSPAYFSYHKKKFGRLPHFRLMLAPDLATHNPQFLAWLERETGYSGTVVDWDRVLAADTGSAGDVFYVNRNSSLARLRAGGSLVEEVAGRSLEERRALRGMWLSGGGRLATGGDYLALGRAVARTVVLVDPPFSEGEIGLLRLQFSTGSLTAAYGPEEYSACEAWLNEAYPDLEITRSVLSVLGEKGQQASCNTEELGAKTGERCGRKITGFQAGRCLLLLSQLGIIDLTGTADNPGIRFLKMGGEVDPTGSLLYLEGKWERAELERVRKDYVSRAF